MSAIEDRIRERVENGTLYPSDFSNLPELLKEGSYLFYELEDCTKETPLDVEVGNGPESYYTKYVSPFFYNRVMNEKSNWELIDIITEEIPFYYIEPESTITEDDLLLQSTRDPGINNVPSVLQEQDFYQTLFRDAFGYIYNLEILDIYNKLRYPYILENQYLNARIFHRMANEAFIKSTDPESRISFKDSEEENSEVYNTDYEFYGEEIGCLDYMQDIVSQKVDSNYSLIDFNPEQSSFLSNWVDSQYQSGQISKSESEEERLLFKLQDIKSELLRRKFSGSYSLYMLMLASIGRMGSYVGVITAGDAKVENTGYYDENGNIVGNTRSYNDERPIRIAYLPGITTKYSEEIEKEVLNPIDVYYFKPEENKKIPLGTLIPLFYSSAPEIYYNGSWDEKEHFGARNLYTEAFMQAIDPDFDLSKNPIYTDPLSVRDSVSIPNSAAIYKSVFYRDNSNVIPWDNISGVLSQDSLIEYYETLDMLVYDASKDAYFYRTLDEILSGDVYNTLDKKNKAADISSVYGSVLDVTANRILYHRNTLQNSGNDYEFLTYPIADGNGPSLMDTPWLNYIEYHSSKKSKVNEDITFGAQVSTFLEVEDSLTVPVEFFAYETKKLNDSGTLVDADYKDCEVVNLYFCILKYESDTFKIRKFSDTDVVEKILISSIRLRHDADSKWIDDTGALKSEYKDFDKFTKYNVGVLPITYKSVSGRYVLSLKLGRYGDDFYDDPVTQGLADAFFVFSDYDTTRDYLYKNIDPMYESDDDTIKYHYTLSNGDEGIKDTIFHGRPSEDIKEIYFAIKKITQYDKSNTTGKDIYSWSDPIRVIPMSSVNSIRNAKEFKPDWFDMSYQLNPYLNFTAESASALRHKKCISGYTLYEDNSEKITYIEGPSTSTWISNLARTRRMDFVCNDTGYGHNSWIDSWKSRVDEWNVSDHPDIPNIPLYKGFYLSHVEGDKELGEKNVSYLFDEGYYPHALIYGDNRYTDRFGIRSNYIKGVTPEDLSSGQQFNDPNSVYYFTGNSVWPAGYYVYDPTVSGTPKWRRLYNVGTLKDFSNIYEDSNILFKSIHIERPELPRNTSSNIDNYLKITPGVKATDYTYWYWNEKKGMTICLNVIFDFDDDFDSEMYLASREGEFTLKMNSQKKIYFESNGKTLTSTLEIESGKSYRISASIGLLGSTLIVNNSIVSGDAISNYNNGTSNAPIILFCNMSSGSQTDCFYGDALDLRLYNDGRSEDNLHILNMGLFREIYSYGPSSYKLAHSVYKDIGIIRMVDNSSDNPTDYGIKNIGSIRVFDRSVWDSIMVDMFPVSTMEAYEGSPQYYKFYKNPKDDTDIYDSRGQLNHCIEQSLIDRLELFNGLRLEQKTSLVYNSKYYELERGSYVTAILALLEPVNYADASIEKQNAIFTLYNGYISGLSGSSIVVPLNSDSSDDYFKYSVDLSPTFNMPCVSSLSRFLSRGSNISLTYYKDIDDSLIGIKNTQIKSAADNFVLIPLTIPDNDSLGSIYIDENDMVSRIDRFRLWNFSLSNDFSRMLRASSYYTEVLIPRPFKKEVGYDILSENSYNVGDNIIEWTNENFKDVYVYNSSDELVKVTSDTAVFVSNVKYYIEASDIPYYRYAWEGIPLLKEGNYYFTLKYPLKLLPFNDVKYLNEKKTEFNTLYGTFKFKISVSISSISTYEDEEVRLSDSSFSMESVTEDGVNSAKSKLQDTSNRYLPEDNRTFNKKVVSIDLYALDSDDVVGEMKGEVEQYSFKWKLIATNNPAYKTSPVVSYLDSEALDDRGGVLIKNKVSMFLVKNYVEPFFIAQYKRGTDGKVVFVPNSADDDTIEPINIYTYKSKDKENLITEKESNMDSIALIAGRSYKILFDNTFLITEFMYSNGNDTDGKTPVSTGTANILDNVIEDTSTKWVNTFSASSYKADSVSLYSEKGTEKGLGITERNLIKSHYDSISCLKITDDLKGTDVGIISGFSMISPSFHIVNGIGQVAELETIPSISISSDKYKLFSYQTTSWEVPFKNNFSILRKSAYGANLLTSMNFKDDSIWKKTFYDGIYSSKLVDKAYQEGGTKYPSIAVGANGSISFYYRGGKGVSINSVYQLNFKLFYKTKNVSVSYNLYNDKGFVVQTGTMVLDRAYEDKEQVLNFYTETTKPLQATTVEFIVNLLPITSESEGHEVILNKSAYFIDCSVCTASAKEYNLGLSDVYYKASPYKTTVAIPRQSIPIFRNNDTLEFFPIQFKNGVINAGGETRPNSSLNRMSSFINDCIIGPAQKESMVRDLTPPWIRRMYVYHRPSVEATDSSDGFDTEIEFHKYSTKKDAFGVASYKEVFSNINDIYTISGDINDFMRIQYQDTDSEKGFVITISADTANNKGIKMLLDSEGSLLSTGCVLNVTGIALNDAKYSFTYNCFDLNRYRQGLSCPVGVTNIQLLNKSLIDSAGSFDNKEVIYEIEYLPIIYDELKNHISFNILLHHGNPLEENTFSGN